MVQTMHGVSMRRKDGKVETFVANEAFMLMKYVRKGDGRVEWLWNSRDGVTPFGVDSLGPDGSIHEDWHEDVFIPNFVPPAGMRIFVGPCDSPRVETVTEELHRAFADLAQTNPFVEQV